jgi:thioredoxin reductase
MQEVYDCLIIGGGPAGLNAGVVLGRCLRKVLIFDTKQYRNRWSHGMHNYLTRDHVLPTEFLKICHEEIRKYNVEMKNHKIVHARKNEDGLFVARTEDGELYYGKKMLIATGLQDNVPNIPGFEEMYGKSVHHCPYCDGWEVRNQRLGVYARDKEGAELALALKGWSADVTLYTDGKYKVKPQHEIELQAMEIPIVRHRIERLQGTDGQIEQIVFKNGETQACDALFFVNGFQQQCNVAETFNCEISRKGVVITNRFQQTTVPGLYVAGDADKDMHFVVVAAAEGAKAGVIINKELQKEIVNARSGKGVGEVVIAP